MDKTLPNQQHYFQFGHEILAPFVYDYLNYTHERINEKAIRNVFFLARDGFLLHKGYTLLFPAEKTRYLYLSRKSVRQALLYQCSTYEESLRYISKQRFITPGTVLEYYGFTKDEIREITAEMNIDPDKDVRFSNLEENPEIRSMYESLKERIKTRSSRQNQLLGNYLEENGFSGRCAVVDVGWHASIQKYLNEFFDGKSEDIPEIYGYYIGTQTDIPVKEEVCGYVYSDEHPERRKDLLCFFGVIEKIMQSNEGSVTGYVVKDDTVIPVLEEYEYAHDEILSSCLASICQGCMAYLNEEKGKKHTEEERQKNTERFIRFGKLPTLKETQLFSFFYNDDGSRYYYVSRKPLYRYKPKEFIHDLSNSPWKTGFVKIACKIPFPFHVIYKVMKK